ncbi:MAG: hypothetical protein ACRC9L_05620 [Brevinema sp.]
MEPLNYLMSVAQSQNFHRAEPSQTILTVQQQNQIAEHQHKVQETVGPIGEHTVDSNEMSSLNAGVGSGSQQTSSNNGGHSSDAQPTIPEKALLDEGTGDHLDILG